MIQELLNDKTDYSISANEELDEIEVLENFIVDNYNPKLNEATKNREINGRKIEDEDYNSIYLKAQKTLDFNVQKTDVISIINSDACKKYNPITEFFNRTPKEKISGYIDKFIACIETDNPDFAKKYFKKWLVSGGA